VDKEKRMDKPQAEKGRDLAKPNIQSKAGEKPMLPSIFTQGEDEKTVECTIKSAEEHKAINESFGTKNPHLWKLFSEQLGGCANSQTGAANKLNQLVPILHDIAPRDTLETMLVVQMVGIHNVAMNCLSRVMNSQQAFEGSTANLKYATKLLQTFTAQMEALQRYRGKSTQQKVTVEHVHVHQGGQAIVGAVNSQGKGGGGGDDDKS